jgi:hypothetical protein
MHASQQLHTVASNDLLVKKFSICTPVSPPSSLMNRLSSLYNSRANKWRFNVEAELVVGAVVAVDDDDTEEEGSVGRGALEYAVEAGRLLAAGELDKDDEPSEASGSS